MPQNLRGRLLERPCLLIRCWLGDGVAQRLRETADDRRVVLRKVVQLDRFRNTVILLRILGCAYKDLRVEVLRSTEMQEGCTMFDDTGLIYPQSRHKSHRL